MKLLVDLGCVTKEDGVALDAKKIVGGALPSDVEEFTGKAPVPEPQGKKKKKPVSPVPETTKAGRPAKMRALNKKRAAGEPIVETNYDSSTESDPDFQEARRRSLHEERITSASGVEPSTIPTTTDQESDSDEDRYEGRTLSKLRTGAAGSAQQRQ